MPGTPKKHRDMEFEHHYSSFTRRKVLERQMVKCYVIVGTKTSNICKYDAGFLLISNLTKDVKMNIPPSFCGSKLWSLSS